MDIEHGLRYFFIEGILNSLTANVVVKIAEIPSNAAINSANRYVSVDQREVFLL